MEFPFFQAVVSGDVFEHRLSERGHCIQDFLAELDLRPDLCNNALLRPYSTDDRTIKRYFTLNLPIAAGSSRATIPTPH